MIAFSSQDLCGGRVPYVPHGESTQVYDKLLRGASLAEACKAHKARLAASDLPQLEDDPAPAEEAEEEAVVEFGIDLEDALSSVIGDDLPDGAELDSLSDPPGGTTPGGGTTPEAASLAGGDEGGGDDDPPPPLPPPLASPGDGPGGGEEGDGPPAAAPEPAGGVDDGASYTRWLSRTTSITNEQNHKHLFLHML